MTDPIPADFLLSAYARGAFPMAMENGKIRWFSPDPRGILPLEAFHRPKGLRRALKREWEIRIDTCFSEVMRACAAGRDTWINQALIDSYTELHRRGHAHSVEVWLDDRLVGGLYGVRLGGAFFGESMFHRVTDASKVALSALVGILRRGGFRLLDIQWTTPHLERFGAVEIPRADYLHRLAAALRTPSRFT